MNKTIVTFVHTEYHLLLFVNSLICEEEKGIKNNHILYLRSGESSRITKTLNFSHLEIETRYLEETFKIDKSLTLNQKTVLDSILALSPDEFVFFQEMDLLMRILADKWGCNKKTKISLFQDGYKPYNILKFNSLALMKFYHKTNIWMKNNGFSIDSWLSPFWSHRYAFIKNIDIVFLTFPQSYSNWNNKNIEKISFLNLEKLKKHLTHIFNWNEDKLTTKENIILYMCQPMHDDGIAETNFLKELSKKYPTKKIYIKTHPLTPKDKLDLYKQFENFYLIEDRVPAELIIMNIKNSIVISIGSTSMFINNPECKFYYLHEMFKDKIKRIKRYKIHPCPGSHIRLVRSINEIKF